MKNCYVLNNDLTKESRRVSKSIILKILNPQKLSGKKIKELLNASNRHNPVKVEGNINFYKIKNKEYHRTMKK